MKFFLMIFLTLTLSACFRDAGQSRGESINVNAREALATQAPATSTLSALPIVPTLVPTQAATTQQLTPSGNLTATSSGSSLQPLPSATSLTAVQPATRSASPTVPLLIPSFTPEVTLGSTFGDSGLTPTFLPGTQPVPAAFVTPTAFEESNVDDCIHIVQANETLFRISQQYDSTPEEMVAINPILAGNPNALQIGQELTIPNCLPEPTATPIPAEAPVATDIPSDQTDQTAPSAQQTYVVQAGDTVYAIGRQFNVAPDAIIAANPELVANPNALYIGQVLVIPAGQ